MPENDFPNGDEDAVSRSLTRWKDGDQEALGGLMSEVRKDLKRMAQGFLKKEPGHISLEPSDLVQEFFSKLLTDQQDLSIGGRRQFFAFAGKAFERILVDQARERRRQKRGGDQPASSLDLIPEEILADPFLKEAPDIDLVLTVHRALEKLARIESQRDGRGVVDVVRMRYFLGMKIKETAAALDRSVSAVNRDWEFARLWLAREISPEREISSGKAPKQ